MSLVTVISRRLVSSRARGSAVSARGREVSAAENILENERKGVFRVLEIVPSKEERKSERRRQTGSRPTPPTRAASMKPDQTWGNVWPAARTFHPATVPLPVRQGVVQTKHQVVPSKWANAELMKISNMLHLTPPVIKTHCAALKKFCTPWPAGLDTEDDLRSHFPLVVTTSDHLNSSSSIRDRRARIVTLKFPLDSLGLGGRARDKFARLVGERYDEKTGVVTITADRCPYRGQNQEYANYLLTALFHESCNVEQWEVDKQESDQEIFTTSEEGREALEQILNHGEDEEAVLKYKEEVRRLLGLPEQTVKPSVVSN